MMDTDFAYHTSFSKLFFFFLIDLPNLQSYTSFAHDKVVCLLTPKKLHTKANEKLDKIQDFHSHLQSNQGLFLTHSKQIYWITLATGYEIKVK